MIARPGKLRAVSILTSVLISLGVIALAGSILLPSTKRARINLHEQNEEAQAEVATTTQPAQH